QRGINHACARRIAAAQPGLHRLDELVAVARLAREQPQNHQPDLSSVEHPLATMPSSSKAAARHLKPASANRLVPALMPSARFAKLLPPRKVPDPVSFLVPSTAF